MAVTDKVHTLKQRVDKEHEIRTNFRPKNLTLKQRVDKEHEIRTNFRPKNLTLKQRVERNTKYVQISVLQILH